MPNGNTIIGTSKPSSGEVTIAAEDNRIKQDMVLRRYMAASSIAQKQMIEKGELAKELYEAGPGGNGKIGKLHNENNSGLDLNNPEQYKQFVDEVVIPKCSDYHEKGYDEKLGARPLRRAVEKYLEDTLAEELLSGNLRKNKPITVILSDDEEKGLCFEQKKSGKDKVSVSNPSSEEETDKQKS